MPGTSWPPTSGTTTNTARTAPGTSCRPAPTTSPITLHEPESRKLLPTRILGGVINEYRYVA